MKESRKESFIDLKHQQIFEIEVDDLKYLMLPPEKDPYSSRPMDFLGQSVMERMLNNFRTDRFWMRSRLTLVLRMPSNKVTEDTESQVKEMLHRYSEKLIRDNKNRLRRIRRKGLRMIPYSLLILILCTSLGILFSSDQLIESNRIIWRAISEGFYIIGWVALWGPIDTLLFEPVDIKKQIELLKKLEDMEIKIVFQ
ncbi:MAG: hypothetical protein QW520_03895 [Methanomassiliicoccales archaeon]